MANVLQNEGYSSLYRKVSGVDLPASEAHYHEKCYTAFYAKHNKWRVAQTETEISQDPSLCAHEHAFKQVKEYIKKQAILDLNVIPLTLLRNLHI